MSVTEAQNQLGAAQVALDSWEREHGTNPRTKTTEQIHEHNRLLSVLSAAKYMLYVAQRAAGNEQDPLE